MGQGQPVRGAVPVHRLVLRREHRPGLHPPRLQGPLLGRRLRRGRRSGRPRARGPGGAAGHRRDRGRVHRGAARAVLDGLPARLRGAEPRERPGPRLPAVHRGGVRVRARRGRRHARGGGRRCGPGARRRHPGLRGRARGHLHRRRPLGGVPRGPRPGHPAGAGRGGVRARGGRRGLRRRPRGAGGGPGRGAGDRRRPRRARHAGAGHRTQDRHRPGLLRGPGAGRRRGGARDGARTDPADPERARRLPRPRPRHRPRPRRRAPHGAGPQPRPHGVERGAGAAAPRHPVNTAVHRVRPRQRRREHSKGEENTCPRSPSKNSQRS
ncbi:hypothetical protein SGPA1_50622 [Streptomyces misionensis JCM 4497]